MSQLGSSRRTMWPRSIASPGKSADASWASSGIRESWNHLSSARLMRTVWVPSMLTAVMTGWRSVVENLTPKWVYRSSLGCVAVASLGFASPPACLGEIPGHGALTPLPRNAGS